MVTYTINMLGFDRGPLAEEVIGSAARLLMLAGFSVGDVSTLFRQAADQIDSGEAVTYGSDGIIDQKDDYYGSFDRYDLVEKFEAQPSVKALSRLSKRASVIDDIEDDTSLSKAMDIVLEAVQLRLEALSWLVSEAESSGLEVAASKERWVETATDDEPDDEDKIVFLDDYQFSGGFNWYLISQVVRYLSDTGSTGVLSSFADLLLNDSLALEDRIRDEVERAVSIAEKFDDFQSYVSSHSGQGELAQSDFLDTFVRIYDFEGGTYLLQNWLDTMAKMGELERVKRSNRWRVTVF